MSGGYGKEDSWQVADVHGGGPSMKTHLQRVTLIPGLPDAVRSAVGEGDSKADLVAIRRSQTAATGLLQPHQPDRETNLR